MLLNHMLKQPSCYCIQPFVIPWTAACDFPVLHHLPEFVQIHVHWVGDAFQPFHSLLFPSPPASDLSQHQGLSLSLSLSLFFFYPESFLRSQLFTLCGQSTGVSASASVLPMSIHGWFWKVVAESQNMPGSLASPPEEKNSIRGQRWGLVAQSFCVIKYKGDRESFWHRHQKGAERIPAC